MPWSYAVAVVLIVRNEAENEDGDEKYLTGQNLVYTVRIKTSKIIILSSDPPIYKR